MFKNYLKSALRSLWKNKFYSVVNILGLTIGLTTSILLLLWIQDEESFDKFNKDYNLVYNLSSHFNVGGKEQVWSSVPGPLYKYAKALAQVNNITRISDDWVTLHRPNSNSLIPGLHIAYVDSSFFSIFNFRALQGHPANVFAATNNILLTDETAKKIFGTDQVIGKVAQMDTINFLVVGVLYNFPQNSSLRFDAILPMSFYGRMFTLGGGNENWKTIDEDLGDYAFDTYIKLRPGADATTIGQALTKSYKNARNGDSQTKFELEPLADKHLISPDGNKSGLRIVQVFIIITILLLVIAAINYVNLSTARSMARAKEVSVRKIIGATKWQLFIQFVLETVIIFLLVSVLALLFTTVLIPEYNDISGKSLQFTLGNPYVWVLIGGAVVGTLMLAAIYPAIHLSSFKPISSLKGKMNKALNTALLRKAMVVLQFSISVILIICTLMIGRQMKYVSNINLGYDKEYVFTVPLSDAMLNHVDAIKSELSKNPVINDVSVSNIYNMADYGNSTGDIDWPGRPKNLNMIVSSANIDKDFIPLMNFSFIEGHNFRGTPSDSSDFIINETMARQMGFKPPYVGKQISLHDSKGTIIGVVKDFHFRSLKTQIAPFVFWTQRGKNILYLKSTAAGAQQAIRSVKKIYSQYPSSNPFTYSFLDANFDALYKTDNRTKLLFNVFAGIAIFISCLGLLALATYSGQVRTKEIGVRKVLGASVGSIVRLLGREFIILVIIAIIIAIPIAYFGMNKWMENFAYRAVISYWLFLLASCLAIGIAALTISFQAIRAALANPVDSLRTE